MSYTRPIMAHSLDGSRAVSLDPMLARRLQGIPPTIFSEMSALAVRTGAVNLGQGFPDTCLLYTSPSPRD